MNYYNSNQKNEIFVNFTTSMTIIKSSLFHCRRCKKIFSFNNELHRHFRVDCQSTNFRFFEKFKFIIDVETYFVKNFNFNESFTIDVTKKINKFDKSIMKKFLTNKFDEFTIIRFNVDSSKNINTKYKFRDLNYVKIKISFVMIIILKNVCLNININVSFMNRNFFKIQTFDISIRIMISSFQIRDLNIN